MLKKSNFKSKIAITLAALICAGTGLYASEAETFIDGMKDGITSASDGFVDLILVIIGFVGIIFVVINSIKYFKGGEQNGENGLFKVGIGLILSVIIVYVIKEVFLGV